MCTYPLHSQPEQAADFLLTHRVVLVTIDIGSNNVHSCVTGLSAIGTIAPPYTIDTPCVTAGMAAAQTDLGTILLALRQAAGPSLPIVGTNYYDPFLAAWTQGPSGQTVATQSIQLGVYFNCESGPSYSAESTALSLGHFAVGTLIDAGADVYRCPKDKCSSSNGSMRMGSGMSTEHEPQHATSVL